jgi:hypothetical protein
MKKRDDYAPISAEDFKQMVGDDLTDDQVDLFKQCQLLVTSYRADLKQQREDPET